MAVNELLSRFIEERRIVGPLRERLWGASANDAEALAQIVVALRPSARTMGLIVDLLEEIAIRDARSTAAVCGATALQAILKDESKSNKERQGLYRRALEQIRFPQVVAVKERVGQLRQELVAEHNVELGIPAELEGDSVTVTIRARSNEELRQRLLAAATLANDERLQELFSILQGEF